LIHNLVTKGLVNESFPSFIDKKAVFAFCNSVSPKYPEAADFESALTVLGQREKVFGINIFPAKWSRKEMSIERAHPTACCCADFRRSSQTISDRAYV